jgi:tripartite-type tricarboxylate transporter receptor subunit TctC
MPKILNELIGTKLKIVTGYKSSADGLLAMERGEVHGRGLYYSTLLAGQRDNYQAGRLKILVQVALEKHPALPDVPFIMDYARSPQDRKLMELLFASLTIGRPIIAPPGLPAERLKILRDSFDATVVDPEFLAEAEKRRMEVVPMKGAEVEKIIRDMYASAPDLVARAKTLEIQ